MCNSVSGEPQGRTVHLSQRSDKTPRAPFLSAVCKKDSRAARASVGRRSLPSPDLCRPGARASPQSSHSRRRFRRRWSFGLVVVRGEERRAALSPLATRLAGLPILQLRLQDRSPAALQARAPSAWAIPLRHSGLPPSLPAVRHEARTQAQALAPENEREVRS